MSWKSGKIGELISVKKGTAITKREANEGPYPVILGGKEPAYYIDRFNHEGKAIVVSRSGASAGYVSFWNEPIFITDGFLIEPNNGISHEFVYYLLKSKQSQLHGAQRGAAIPHVTPALIKDIDVVVPPVEAQNRIAEILSVYDNLIENNQKQIKLLEEAAQRLYKEWFVDLHFPGHETTDIVDGVPAMWQKSQLSELFSCIRGKSYTSSELSDTDGVVFVNLKNMQAWGGYKRENEKRFLGTYKAEQKISQGDIVMAVTDMTQERRLVGHVALIPKFSQDAIFSMDLIKLCPSEGVPKSYLYSYLRFSGIAEEIARHANGTNVLHLRPENITSISAIIPTKKTMSEFDKKVAGIFTQIDTLEAASTLIAEARDRLLPKLMNGEIEV